MTLPLIFDEMLPNLLHEALSKIWQIVASMVTVSVPHRFMLEIITKFDDVGNCVYMFEMFYPLVLWL